MNRGGGLVVVAVVIAGCSSSAAKATLPTTAAPATVTTVAKPQACVRHPIEHAVRTYYGVPIDDRRPIDFVAVQEQLPAHDGDGNTIRYTELSVERSGPGGTLRLTRADGLVIFRGFGDFDGDGRSDLLIDTGPNYDTYIVRGTIASGTHDPAVVGVRVPNLNVGVDRVSGHFPASVGDQDGDGTDDLSAGSAIYSGRALAAGGAALPAPIRTLTAPYAGLLQVDANAPPSFVVPDDSTRSVRVLDRHADQLLLDGSTRDLPTRETGARATGWIVNGHHIVEYGYSNRSGATQWRWDLDAPCSA